MDRHQGGPGRRVDMPLYTVDASIYASIIVKDESHIKAAQFLEKHQPTQLATIDLAYIEALNTLWKHTTIYKRIPAEKYPQLTNHLIKLINQTTATTTNATQLLKEAAKLATKYEITIYDALYVAAAEKHKTKLATLDKKLAKKLRQKGYKNILLI